MADISKAEKLAAARKKLREFQHNREHIVLTSSDNKIGQHPPGSATGTFPTEPDPVDYNNSVNFSSRNLPHASGVQHQLCEYQQNNSIFDSLNISHSSKANIFTPENETLPNDEKINRLSISPVIASSTPVVLSRQELDSHFVRAADDGLSSDGKHSSSETLRQLALQMNGLVGQELDGAPTLMSDLPHEPERDETYFRNQELAAQLMEKDQTIAQLAASLAQIQDQCSQQEKDFQRALAESQHKWETETAALREQLQLHTQTVGILVADKTEAQAALSKAQIMAKTKAAEAEEAQGRLRASRHKISELEAALSSLRSGQETGDTKLRDFATQVQKLEVQLKNAMESRRESREESSQLQERLHTATQQVASLQAELSERQSQLSMAHVRLQQLGSSAVDSSEVSAAQVELQAEHERRIILEQEVVKLTAVVAEKDQGIQQCQQFIQQLNAQLTSLAAKLQESNEENESLHARQQSLVQHLSQLELRLQQRPPPSPKLEEVPDQGQLIQQLEALGEDKLVLEEKLTTQAGEVTELQMQLSLAQEKITELQEGRPDEAKLLAAMESDKVAAARATSQNAQLKQQMTELQHVHAQMADSLRHAEVQAQQAQALQRDLLKAREEIKNLENENSRLKVVDRNQEESSEPNRNNGLVGEAAEKLQERFTATMKRLAEVSDEKQQLEHLVLQLQGETETIGEYVALYQEQRSLLQQRAAEKDREVARMAADREQMRANLQRVSHLVSVLVSTQNCDHLSSEDQGAPVSEEISSQARALNNDVAGQISALLMEIGDSETLASPSSLVPVPLRAASPSHYTETMLPCPLCSGRLEVV